jgi:hypothetical protein
VIDCHTTNPNKRFRACENTLEASKKTDLVLGKWKNIPKI